MGWSWSTVLMGSVYLIVMGSALRSFHKLVHPLQHIPAKANVPPFIKPGWGTKEVVEVLLCADENSMPECSLLFEETVHVHGDPTTHDLLLMPTGMSRNVSAGVVQLPKKLWKRMHRPQSRVMCVAFVGGSKKRKGDTVPDALLRVKQQKERYRVRWLLQDVGLGHLSGVSSWNLPEERIAMRETVHLWQERVSVNLVNEKLDFPVAANLPVVHRLKVKRKELTYDLPVYISADPYLTKPVVMNASQPLPLRVTLTRSAFSTWMLSANIAVSLERLSLPEEEKATLNELINTGAMFWVIMVVTTVHLLFEFLACRADIRFWSQNSSLWGLSVRALFSDLMCQVVALLYNIDMEASLLITASLAVTTAIQLWKCRRATGATLRRGKWGLPSLAMPRIDYDTAGLDKDTRLSLEVDRSVQRYLVVALLPAALVFAAWSIVMEQHAGWYSWLIHSMYGFVFVAGFLQMTPQLVLNYKLKSVEHLPWDMLCYRFFNTIVDDCFIFVTNMPTMHRVSCLRDDVVFIIYVYQRWMYPVDHTRGSKKGEGKAGKQD